MQTTLLVILALFATGLGGCAARELRCDGSLEPINAAPAASRAQHPSDDHAR